MKHALAAVTVLVVLSATPHFNVWAGPGTFVNGVEAREGFIIDWASGAVKPDEHYRLNTPAIHRGRERNWFRASTAWQNAVKHFIAQVEGQR